VSLALGMGLTARLNGSPSRTYVMLGDGEIQEGQNWEAAMFAAYHKLENLTVIVDYNHIQLDGFVKDILDVSPLAQKFESFGWRTLEIDGQKARTDATGRFLLKNLVPGHHVLWIDASTANHAGAKNSEINAGTTTSTAACGRTTALGRRNPGPAFADCGSHHRVGALELTWDESRSNFGQKRRAQRQTDRAISLQDNRGAA